MIAFHRTGDPVQAFDKQQDFSGRLDVRAFFEAPLIPVRKQTRIVRDGQGFSTE